MKTLSAIGASFILIMTSEVAFADQVTVTTYVTRVQEERASTRWTLTEWLHIKERMKLMDVWLAMFSDPVKDRFSPELNMSWFVTRAHTARKEADTVAMEGDSAGHEGRAQFWMTNLVSSTFGVRTLNIDLGVEGGQHDSGSVTDLTTTNTSSAAASTSLSTSESTVAPVSRTTWYTGNLRLFGKNIQDTSLVLKYGLIQTNNTWQLPGGAEFAATSSRDGAGLATGTMAGLELQIYLLKWLGAEGTAHSYLPMTVAFKDHKLSGYYGEALVFVEISLLRLVAGRYEEQWDASWSQMNTKTRETGYLAGVKINI